MFIALFAIVKSLFMTALLPDRRYRIAFSLAVALSVVVSHTYAPELNKLHVQRLLAKPSALADISLAVMIDTVLTITFCLARLKNRPADGSRFAWYTALWRHMPSLLVFPALFYLHIELLFALPTVDFTLLSVLLAIGVVLLFVGASTGLRTALGGEKELLIELTLLITAVQFVLAIANSVFHPAHAVGKAPATTVDWSHTAAAIGLLAAVAIVGFAIKQIGNYFKR